MKLIFTTLTSFFLAINVFAQSGIGIVTYSQNPLDFGAVNVDSTESVNVTFWNTVAAPQVVNFSGINYVTAFTVTPTYSTLPSSAVTIPANDSSTVTIRFNPDSTGFFNNTLSWSGSIFGNGTLDLEGEGVLPIIDIDTDTIDFGIMPLGTSSISTINISNNGSGSLVVDSLSSAGVTEITFDDQTSSGTVFPFSTTSSAVAVDVEFSSISAGSFGELIYIYSNDPYNPTTSIYITATCVSQISGNLCNMVLDKSNNPYDVTDNLYVADSCFLDIGPGVELNMNGYKLHVDGNLYIAGTANDSIDISSGSIQYNNDDTLSLSYVNFTNDSSIVSGDGTVTNIWWDDCQNTSHWDIYGYTSTGSPILGTNWGNNNSYSFTQFQQGGYYNTWGISSSYSYSGYGIEFANSSDYDLFIVSDPISISESGNYTISAFAKAGYIAHCYNIENNAIHLDAYYSINNGSWVHYYETAQNTHYSNYFEYIKSPLISLEPGDQLKIIYYIDNKFGNYMYQNWTIDDVKVDKQDLGNLVVFSEDFENGSDQWNSSDFANNPNEFQIVNTEKYEGDYSLKIDGNYYSNGYNYNDQVRSIEITIPESGKYFLEYYQKVTSNGDGCLPRHYWNFNTNSTSYNLYYPDWECLGSYKAQTYDWRKVGNYIGSFNAGDVINIEFGYELYSSSSSNNYVTFYIDDVKVMSAESSQIGSLTNNIYSSLNIDNSIFYNVEVITKSDSSSINLDKVRSSNFVDNFIDFSTTENYSPIIINNSEIQNITSDGNTSYITINNSNLNSAYTDGKYSSIDVSNSMVRNADASGLETDQKYSPITVNSTTVKNSGSVGLRTSADSCEIHVFDSKIINNGSKGIYSSGSYSSIHVEKSFINNNLSDGVYASSSTDSEVDIKYSQINNNNGYSAYSSSRTLAEYSNFTNNLDRLYSGNSMSDIKNCILWGNNNGGAQLSGNHFLKNSSIQYKNVYTNTSWNFSNCIDADPMFVDTLQHLDPSSLCVDGGTINENDAHMPYGLGGPRADIGMYGGPGNWVWGGSPAPEGSPTITSIEDSPQDQGGMVGVLFDGSVWDNSSILNNVTSYSFWRHYDVNGLSIDSVDQGNWELIGNMPAQNFGSYAFSAATLGDSNLVTGMFNSCYIVVAHTGDSSVYWNSNVLCGYSVDNLAPSAPIASARVNQANTEVTVHWSPPTVSDYSYSNVISTSGFVSLGVIDTSVVDLSILPGGSYTYGVVHFDVNGNASDTAWVSISIDDNEDVIPLSAGWNLISTSKVPVNNNMLSIFANLQPGNLIYVTGFNQGSSLYNPNGLPFLNTLNQLNQGYGYWIKVANDDTLRINGTTIDDNFKIDLDAGWNLSGYMNSVSQTPNQYFSDLISNNNLIYATAFNQGTQLFNPNGLPFLNTLTQMERPFGYWIKVNNAVGGNQYRLSNSSGVETSPDFMFVNGKSNLDNYVGQHVLVLNSNGDEMAKLEILEQGYLMTTSLYGDDITTDYLEGFAENEEIIFSFGGQEIKSDFNFISNMELQQVKLEFVNLNEFSIYPNPAKSSTNISFEVENNCKVEVKAFDLTGKLLNVPFSSDLPSGYHNFIWNTSNLEKGMYIIKLFVNEKYVSSQRLVLQ